MDKTPLPQSPLLAEKQAVRRLIRERKSAYSPEQLRELSAQVMAQVELTAEFKKAKTIMTYWAMPDEVQTYECICRWFESKKILLPTLHEGDIVARSYEGEQSMESCSYYTGIMEPTGPVYPAGTPIDLILVPGLAFDHQNSRLGRGRGYYDRFLAATPGFRMGICFDFQQLDKIPAGPADVKMDRVVTNC